MGSGFSGCTAQGNLGRLYKSSVCGSEVMYCGSCFDEGHNRSAERRMRYRPMKVIFGGTAFTLFFRGAELPNGEALQVFKCPLCEEIGFIAQELQAHVTKQHGQHSDGPALLAILEKMICQAAVDKITEELENRNATEIRCQEKSRGGLSYEVILAEPAPNVAVPKRPVTPGKNVSVEEIEQKLKAAEERRVSLEAKKMADISNKLAKVEEATRKKDEITNEFITQTKEQLESKMELHVEKREAIISDMKEKLKIHAQEIEKTRETLEQQKANEQKAIEEKLKIAQSLRDENIKKMLDRLKEHERRAELVRQNKAHAQDIDGQQSPIASSG
ncbi:uncharacterized protein LOC108093411 isoform X2 [Drosophila ficusphila]|uniref:uncharacterized protein LOC108093411 isoform X2 n=1 Tax=Drosophila ficusphila TaxID=30025 RepID=UPI0007E76418|nr:uncharacterized protein LOC108093411 isoform X2 [Drosophila ficusphila]